MSCPTPTLFNLLKSADLLNYHEQLKTTLKLRNAKDLALCKEKDFTLIGMSRPEQKRLKQEYNKHNFPGPSTSLAYKLKKKMFGGSEPANNFPEDISPTETQHVIAAENINLCKELGKGEFGCVFQAAWHMENKDEVLQVAVKRVLPEKLVSNPNSFLQEAAIMCKMRHDNVIRLYGVVLDTKAVMLVSELAPCGSLLECLQCDSNMSSKSPAWREPLSIPTLCDFCLQIAQGMHYLTSKRLIHRDLAARNVLVASPTKVKISDFGLSRSLGVGEDYYRSDFNPTMKLPIAWCAPECINFLRFTPASDVWAFAVTLWEIFTYGKMPWDGYSGAQILTAIDHEHKKLDWPEACPTDFYSLQCECWAHQPEARPTFEDLVERLPKIMPQQLISITSCTTDHPQILQFSKGDLVVLINKMPTSVLPHSEGEDKMWFGASRRTGQLGLFRPEDTVAYLGAENPSTSSSSSLLLTGKQSNGVSVAKKQVLKDSKAGHLLGGESDKERKKLLISQPHADLRHTCHVGIDGRSFGLLHVNKTEFSRALLTSTASNSLSVNTRPPSTSLSNTSSAAVSPLPPSMSSTPPPTLPPKRTSFGSQHQQPLAPNQPLQITNCIQQTSLPPPRPPKPIRNDSKQLTSPNSSIDEASSLSAGVSSFPLDSLEKYSVEPLRKKEPEECQLQRPSSICASTSLLSCDGLEASSDVTFPYSTSDSVFSRASLTSSHALDQVLNDLQKDISDFSLSTIADFADTRPLLHDHELHKPASDNTQQHSIVRAMTPEETDKWQKRVEEEHKKATKCLNRLAKKEIGSLEEELPVDCTVSPVHTDKTSGTFTSQLTCSPEEWSAEAMAAYKLLVQCGSFLKNTPNNTNSTTTNGRKTRQEELIQNMQQKHKIEYINSKLMGFNQPMLPVDNNDYVYNAALDSKKVEYENDKVAKKLPPAVPPKPKKRNS